MGGGTKVDALSDEETQASKAQTQWVLNLVQSRSLSALMKLQSIDSHAVLENFAEKLRLFEVILHRRICNPINFAFPMPLRLFLKTEIYTLHLSSTKIILERYIARAEWVAPTAWISLFLLKSPNGSIPIDPEVSWAANPAEAQSVLGTSALSIKSSNELLSNTSETLGEDAEEGYGSCTTAACPAIYGLLRKLVMETVREKIERRYQRNLKILEDQEISDDSRGSLSMP